MKLAHVGRSAGSLTSYPAHRHARWELIYNCSGSGSMTAEGRDIPFADGTVVLLPPGTLHTKQAPAGFEDYYFHFTGCDFQPRIYVLEDDCQQRLLKLIQVLHSTYFESGSCQVCQCLFQAVMGLLQPSLDQAPRDKYVQQLRHIIIQGFTDPDFKLQQAQRAIPIEPDHLRRRFTRESGQTPHAYLTSLRMEYAKELLAQGLPVGEVALRAGFYDPLYFSRLFRRHTGLSPSQWKQSGK